MPSQPLRGKVAVITGASRGIGRACALRLAEEGVAVVVAAKTEESSAKSPGSIHDVAREIEALGARALPVRCDVRSEDDVRLLIEQAAVALGRIDILINNAGAIWWQEVEHMPLKRFLLMWDVNVKATFLTCHYAIPHLRAAGGGHVINMSPPLDRPALATNLGMHGKGPYLVTKYGMTILTRALAEELRPARVAVNALWPATAIDTQATRVFGEWFGHEAIPYRSPRIQADAVLEICRTPPADLTGQTLIDEEFLRGRGYADFTVYDVRNPHLG